MLTIIFELTWCITVCTIL